MKRKEFLSSLEEMGYGYMNDEVNGNIYILTSEIISWVSGKKEFTFQILNLDDEQLADLIFQYSKTPTEDREEENKYTLSLPMHYSDDYRHKTYLNKVDDETYIFNVEEDLYPISTFTQEEIDNLPNQDFIKALIKKEV